ncbi:MAG: RNA polymerase [Thermoplasmata archaeon]|nr:RNA polymerase [Thermoplasmata archaeon]MCI4344252.1 RNA polymerase [Thermoplasmata archaeon]
MPDPVPVTQVRTLLAEEAARRTLPREATLALQHAELFHRLTPEQTEKLIAELRTIPFIDANLAVKLADVLPQYPEEVRLLVAKERVLLDEAQLTRLLEIIAQNR